MLPTITWENNNVVMIDQRKLPGKEVYVRCASYLCVAESIEKMVIRGAPAIGVAAAYGITLGLHGLKSSDRLDRKFLSICNRFEKTRPTAINLFWAIEHMKKVFRSSKNEAFSTLKQIFLTEAKAMDAADVEANQSIGFWGKNLFGNTENVLTHCNAGALATAGYGTALGVIRAAHEAGKKVKVYSSETRPLLQGARLTCWELKRDNIPVTLITDNMAGSLMAKGKISVVITGADRIAANGDTANKIGTYSVAVLAKEHGIPFYVAAPLSTIDFNISSGSEIPIEERAADEVRKIGSHYLTVSDVEVSNPAFDVTPSRLITSIITEKGIVTPPYKKGLGNIKVNKK